MTSKATVVALPLNQATLQQARQSGPEVMAQLAALAQVDAATVLEWASQALGWPRIDDETLARGEPAFALLPLRLAMERCALLLHDAGKLMAVIAEPFDTDLHTWLETLARGPLQYRLALPEQIEALLRRCEAGARTVGQVAQAAAHHTVATDATTEVLSFESVHGNSSPAIQMVNSTLYDALKAGASDVHLESTPTGMAIKYRIDGVLDQAAFLNGIERSEQVVSRLKVLCELDISERRIPQDGSFRVRSGGRDIDLRVSIMPSIHGEDAVVRILDKQAMVEAHGALTLEALGFDAPSLARLRQLAAQPYGMLLVTGPTGSGKTTTLYGAISEIHDGREKIITIEDPVEYQLPGVLQIPVNEKKGLTFARGLRSILRHDPDKIMVGEIRDQDTAQIAVQSALTGHLVLTTVHANNVFDVFGRFTHMGVDPYAFASALNGIWAQRLVRINCAHCSGPVDPGAAALARHGITHDDAHGYTWRAGAGCVHCRGTGYKHRRAIAEVLTLNDELRELVVDKAPIRRVKEAAHRLGTRSLHDAALELVRRGETTLAEVQRVTLHA